MNPTDGKAPLERLYITGHSLGGAMAVLAAARLFLPSESSLGRLGHGVYTFGQPAVGNAEFAEKCESLFGERLYRHIYAHDVVRSPLDFAGDDHAVDTRRRLRTPGAPGDGGCGVLRDVVCDTAASTPGTRAPALLPR